MRQETGVVPTCEEAFCRAVPLPLKYKKLQHFKIHKEHLMGRGAQRYEFYVQELQR